MDKALERAAVTVALREMNVRAIREFERPDFIALVDRHIHVGIEITELWASQTEARLDRIDGYVQQLIDGHPRHREDARETRIAGEGQLTKPDGTSVPIGPGVISPIPSLSRHLDLIAKSIETKSRKYSTYAKPLNGHELVIVDHITWGNAPAQPLPCSALLTQRLLTALRLAPFQDVIVLAVADEDRQYSLSLRTLELADRFTLAKELTESVWTDTPPNKLQRLSMLALLSFAEHSKSIGFGFTLDPEAIHLGRFSVQPLEASAFEISDSYGEPPGFVLPTWPQDITAARRAELIALMLNETPKKPPLVQLFNDITSELVGNILVRRNSDVLPKHHRTE